MDIHVSTTPRHLRITDTMLEDLLWDPVMAAWVFFKIKLDAFQRVRLKIYWFTPDVEDHSGFTSGKTLVDWIFANLSAVLEYDCHVGVIFQTFQIGKDNFWQYYRQFTTPLFRAQLGQFAEEQISDKSQFKEPGCWKQHFKNKSLVAMPAPGFLQEARNLAGWRVNRLIIDEWTKIMASAGGEEGITKQLLGRVTRACFNQHHPVRCNKIIRSATPELGAHPANRVVDEFEREMKRGNPDYFSFGFSFKDYSNLRCHTGKTFKEEYRDEKRLRTLKLSNAPEKYRAEGLGKRQKFSKDWYTQEMIDAAHELGKQRKLDPVLNRLMDPFGSVENCNYFLGIDPAPAQGQRSDAGALVALRARPLVSEPSQYETDWALDYVWAMKVAGRDIEWWSGHIHEKQQDFGFAVIVLDVGSGGGGIWMVPELRKDRQTISGTKVSVVPIVPRHTAAIEGQMVLVSLTRGDEDIKKLWPELKHAQGDDVLRAAANTLFQTALAKGFLALPVKHHERDPKELIGWPPERVWASKLLTATGMQITKVKAETDEKGDWKLTRNNVQKFFALGKDDFHDAARNAYIAFRIWLIESDLGFTCNKEDEGLCDVRAARAMGEPVGATRAVARGGWVAG